MDLVRTSILVLLALPSVQGRFVGMSNHPKLLDRHTIETDAIQSEYVVVLNDSTENIEGALEDLINSTAAEIRYVYKNIFKGASIRGIRNFELASFLDHSFVKYVSPVSTYFLFKTLFLSMLFNC